MNKFKKIYLNSINLSNSLTSLIFTLNKKVGILIIVNI